MKFMLGILLIKANGIQVKQITGASVSMVLSLLIRQILQVCQLLTFYCKSKPVPPSAPEGLSQSSPALKGRDKMPPILPAMQLRYNSLVPIFAAALGDNKTMTLTLTPGPEARLRALSAQRGLPPEETIVLLLAEADFNDAAAGIQRGMDDHAAGRWISLEDYDTRIEAQKQARANVQNTNAQDAE